VCVTVHETDRYNVSTNSPDTAQTHMGDAISGQYVQHRFPTNSILNYEPYLTFDKREYLNPKTNTNVNSGFNDES
jgi:hypothetical protein